MKGEKHIWITWSQKQKVKKWEKLKAGEAGGNIIWKEKQVQEEEKQVK